MWVSLVNKSNAIIAQIVSDSKLIPLEIILLLS
jgi:hypothetical protein